MEICYLCGQSIKQGELSRDHVPPKGLLTRLDSRQITLLVHRSCNESYSADEEHFRNNISAISWSHPRDVWQKVYRSLRRKPGKLAEMVSRLYPVNPSAPGSLHALKIPMDPTNRILLKIASGLHFHHVGRRVPDKFSPHIYFEPRLDSIPTDVIRKSQYRGRHGDDFAYAGAVASDSGISLWTLSFYKSVVACVAFLD